MKKKSIFIIYGVYVVVLIGLLVVRIFGVISKDILSMVYLAIFILELAYCCGGDTGIPNRNLDTVETLKYRLESRNSDPLLIKPLILMFVPLIIIFVINYFCL